MWLTDAAVFLCFRSGKCRISSTVFGSVKVYCSYFYQLQAVLMIYVGYSYAVIDVKLAERSQTDNQ